MMAGVLFVIYIPCDDSEDTSGAQGKSDCKRETKGPTASKAEVEKKREEKDDNTEENAAIETTPLVQSDSGIASVSQDLGTLQVCYDTYLFILCERISERVDIVID